MSNDKQSYIHASCAREDKARWVKIAQIEKMKLTDWINKVLNKESEKHKETLDK